MSPTWPHLRPSAEPRPQCLQSPWLDDPALAPAGGLELIVEYRSGRGEGGWHLPRLNPILAPFFGGDLLSGLLNLWADHPVRFPVPIVRVAAGEPWWFSPVIIREQAAGIAARRADSGDIAFLEVYASRKIATEIGLEIGDRLSIRILEGRHLDPAA